MLDTHIDPRFGWNAQWVFNVPTEWTTGVYNQYEWENGHGKLPSSILKPTDKRLRECINCKFQKKLNVCQQCKLFDRTKKQSNWQLDKDYKPQLYNNIWKE